jgi:hypothetical protein
MAARLTGYSGFLWKGRRTVAWVALSTVIGIGAYAYLISTFLEQNRYKGASESVFNPTSNGDFYSITLKSADHDRELINFDMDINAPEGRGEITKCLYFGYRSSNPFESFEGLSAVLVSLKEIPRDSLQPDQQPGPGYTTYRGAGQFHFETDLRLFPFDKILWDFSVSEQCWSPAAAIDSTTFRNLWIRNNIRDYALFPTKYPKARVDPLQPSFVLRRSTFLRVLTIVVFAVAFASSIALILRAREKAKGLSLLTYFAGLWGIREILLSPIQGLKAFPSLIEITILFLFGFTLVGVVLASRHTPGSEEKPTD